MTSEYNRQIKIEKMKQKTKKFIINLIINIEIKKKWNKGNKNE